ncbi:hypothetical protein CERSUDRAFT_70547 [Gelatoporia subvermispora B]|uniref:WW domain-containing protein n=1 Tax=Ceriporiopsis subvermispora (strain B) TaxID=914234 RepID=M2RCI8_CERS8|nr:hypothetical protein CERSUDRAFT_70547 [Gelatoporia subvermispora B]
MAFDPTRLPDGWVQEFDPNNNHPFWVDTRANPPRSIWVHPYEDEQFLKEHPDIRDKLAQLRAKGAGPDDNPPPYSPRRHSYSGTSSNSRLNVPRPGGANDRNATSHPPSPAPGASAKQRGFFGKLKDKAIGTKEEREAAQREQERVMQEVAQQRAQQRRQQRVSAPGYAVPGPSYRPSYGAPVGSPGRTRYTTRYGSGLGGFGRNCGYGGGYGGYGGGYGYGDGYGRSGFGGGGLGGRSGFGGVGLPLLGGMAGGLLLGEAIGDLSNPGFGFGGGFGGFDNGFGGGFF